MCLGAISAQDGNRCSTFPRCYLRCKELRRGAAHCIRGSVSCAMRAHQTGEVVGGVDGVGNGAVQQSVVVTRRLSEGRSEGQAVHDSPMPGSFRAL